MEKSEILFRQLKKSRLIALLSPKNAQQCVRAYETLNPLGITLEIAFRTEAAEDGVKLVLNKYPGALILAGTVMTVEQARKAIDAGASGIVSADYIPSVLEECIKRDIMCIPGGLSDAGKQLAHKAELLNCDFETLRVKHPCQWIYKLFPAVSESQSNAGLAKALKGPYKQLTIIYTGGINLNNLRVLAKQDPEGIFCASALAKNVDDAEKLKKEVEKWIEAVQLFPQTVTVERSIERQNSTSVPKVVTFGEIMLRLSPPNCLRFVQAKSFDVQFGGAEANTAVAFANYGLASAFVSALPMHEIGRSALNALRTYGVDTSHILRRGGRIGIYFLEYGASQRSSKVIYDRAGSSVTELQPGQIDWKEIFKDADWFHWSGITPALGENLAEVTKEALIAAKEAGVAVSVDLNYRKKLWSREKAGSVTTPLMEYVDICIGNEEDAECFFNIKSEKSDVESGKIDEKSYEQVAKQLVKKFGLKKAAITLRESVSASKNNWSACLYNGKEFLLSHKYSIDIIDRVGGGDSFSSGFIYGMLSGKSDIEALEFGAAASCLKQTIHGDFNLVSIEEVENLAGGKIGGRILR